MRWLAAPAAGVVLVWGVLVVGSLAGHPRQHRPSIRLDVGHAYQKGADDLDNYYRGHPSAPKRWRTWHYLYLDCAELFDAARRADATFDPGFYLQGCMDAGHSYATMREAAFEGFSRPFFRTHPTPMRGSCRFRI